MISLTSGIPQSAANPLIGILTGDDERRAKENAWRLKATDALDQAVLDYDGFIKGKPAPPLDFAADPDTARKQGIVASYLQIQAGGRPISTDPVQLSILRDRVADQQFAGRGKGDDLAFYGEIEKETTGRHQARVFFQDLAKSAAQSALMAAAGEPAAEYPAWMAEARQRPGYRKDLETAYLTEWRQRQRELKQQLDPVRDLVARQWQAMKEGKTADLEGLSGYMANEESREVLLYAIGGLVKALPKEQQPSVLANLRKQFLRRDLPANLEGIQRSMRPFDRDEPLPEDYLDQLEPGYDLEKFNKVKRAEFERDSRARDRFLRKLESIVNDEYDPIVTHAKEGSNWAAFEKGLYAAPGVALTVGVNLIPGAGQFASYEILRQDSTDQARAALIQGGMDEDRADLAAADIGTVSGLIQLPMERLGISALTQRLPFINRAVNRITTGLATRYLARAGSSAAVEFTTEMGQNLVPSIIQDIAAAASQDIPETQWTGKGGVFQDYDKQSLEVLGAILPLSLIMAGGGVFRDQRIQTVAAADDLTLRAAGMSDAAIQSLRAATGIAEQEVALEAAWQSRDINSPDAQAAQQELTARVQAEQSTAAAASDNGIMPRAVRGTDGTWTLYDTATGSEIGQAPDWQRAAQLATTHANFTADQDADRIALVFSTYQAAEVSGQWGTDTNRPTEFNLDLGRQLTAQQAAAESSSARERVAAQERLMGGDGSVTNVVLGQSRTELAQGQLRTVNRILEGGSVLDVFHEETHGFRRQAHARGILTREDDLAFVSAVNTVLQGQTTREGAPLQLLPADFATLSESDQETALDEAISAIAEAEVVRTRKGSTPNSPISQSPKSRSLPPGLVSNNLSALARLLGDRTLGKFRSFIAAIREYFGLAIDRAAQIQRGLADGTLDRATYEGYLAKLLGVDEQIDYDQMARDAESAILDGAELAPAMAGDPFSLGQRTTVTPTASTRAYPGAEGSPSVIGPASFSIRAHHGTPHKVDKFTTGKIGTGEGAQAYGWGLYFAEDARVADSYRAQLKPQRPDGHDTAFTAAARSFIEANGIVTLDDLRAAYPDADTQALEYAIREARGQENGLLYTVTLKVEDDQLLDWDNSFTDQPPVVQQWMRSVISREYDLEADETALQESLLNQSNGEGVYRLLANNAGDQQTISQELLKLGIRGIRYLDGNSRGNAITYVVKNADGKTEFSSREEQPALDYINDIGPDGDLTLTTETQGSYNYVVFDEADIEILEENGQPVNLVAPSFSLGSRPVRVTPAQDAAYLAAVEAEDIAAALKIATETEPPLSSTMPQVGAFSRDIGGKVGLGGWDTARGMSRNAAAAEDAGRYQESDFRDWIADALGLKSVTASALSSGNVAAANTFREYHHVGPKRKETDFYDPEIIDRSPRFWLGLADHFQQLPTGKKPTAAALRKAREAWGKMQEVEPETQSGPVMDVQAIRRREELEKLPKSIARRREQIAKWEPRILAGEKAPFYGYLETQKAELAKEEARLAELQKESPTRAANAADMAEARETVPGSESRQSLAPNIPKSSADASEFSLGSRRLGVLTQDSIRRIQNPLRRVQAMERVSRKLEDLRLEAERLELLSGTKRLKRSLAREAAIRQALRREELENEAWARHAAILSDDDLTKLRAQPGHAALADPSSPLRGRLLSRTAAAKKHPDLFQLHQNPAEYEGSERVSRTLFGGTLTPDLAADELFAAGLLREASTDALWQLLESEARHVASMKKVLEAAKADLREARTVAKAETNAWLATQVDTQATVYSPRQEILRSLAALDAILSSVPAEIRGKVGGYVQAARIADPDSGLQFLRERLAKTDAELEKYLKSQYNLEFLALLDRARPEKDEAGKRPRGKIGADVHALFADLREAMTLTAAETEAEATRLEILAEQEDLTPEQQSHAMLQANLVRLVGDWPRATAARREAAVLEATRVFESGYMEEKIRMSRQREDRAKKRTNLAAATGKAGTREERRVRAQRDEGTRTGRVLKAGLSLMSFEQVVQKAFGEGTADAEALVDWERRAAHAKADALQNKLDLLEDLFASLAGGKLKGEQLRFQMSDAKGITATDAKGRTHTFSQLEAITATLMWRQEDGRRHMEGHVDDQGAPAGEWNFTQDFVDQLEDQLTDNAKAIRLHLAQQYAAEYQRLNSVFRQLYGVSLPRHAHYSPLTVKPAQAGAGQTLDPVTGSTMTGAGLTPGALKTRSQTAIAEPDFRDALQTYIGHSKQMEHWIAYAPFATEAMALINARNVGNSVEAAAGKETLQTLRGWLDVFAQGGTRDAAAHLAANQLLNRMIGRAAATALVGRVSVLAIQSTQLGAALAEMPAGAYITRLARLFAGRLDWSAALRSDYIQRRKAQMPPVVQQALEGLSSSKPSRLKYLARKMGETISGADALFTAGTFAITYDYHLKQAQQMGVADPQSYARQAAERSTDRVAQPTRTGTRSLYEVTGTNPAVRIVWSFASEPRQKLMLAAYAFSSKKSKGAKARALAVAWLAGGLVASVIRATMRDIRDDDDDEIFDEKNWDPKRLALSSLTGPFAGIPFLGDALEATAFGIAGEYLPDGNLFSNAPKALERTADLIMGDHPEDLEEAVKDAETILSGAGLFSDSAAATASFSHLLRDLVNIVENATGTD